MHGKGSEAGDGGGQQGKEELLRLHRGHQGVAPPIDSEHAALLYVDEVLDGQGRFLHIDTTGSVSAPTGDGDPHG